MCNSTYGNIINVEITNRFNLFKGKTSGEFNSRLIRVSDYFYLIRFNDCLKGINAAGSEVPINKEAGIIKFYVR